MYDILPYLSQIPPSLPPPLGLVFFLATQKYCHVFFGNFQAISGHFYPFYDPKKQCGFKKFKTLESRGNVLKGVILLPVEILIGKVRQNISSISILHLVIRTSKRLLRTLIP